MVTGKPNDFVGESQVRIAFVFINQYGNQLFLDDIEFFLTSDSNLPRPEENAFLLYPNPVGGNQIKTTFNLADNDNVNISIYDSRGSVVYQKWFTNTLNQTYTFEIPGLVNGIYYVRVRSQQLNETKKLIVTQ